jgi:flagellar protein FliL
MKNVVIALIVVSGATLSALGWLYYTGDLASMVGGESVVEESTDPAMLEPGEPSEPIYLPLDPPFLVNVEMSGTLRFLQVSIEVMARDPAVIQSVEAHMPHMRNNILLVLSDQTLETVVSAEAKEKLRARILKETQFVLTQLTGDVGVEAIYFTSFVLQ